MDGTERLFERMVHEHQDRVFALSLALTGNRHDAGRVESDAFLAKYWAAGRHLIESCSRLLPCPVKSGQSQPSRLEAWVNQAAAGDLLLAMGTITGSPV